MYCRKTMQKRTALCKIKYQHQNYTTYACIMMTGAGLGPICELETVVNSMWQKFWRQSRLLPAADPHWRKVRCLIWQAFKSDDARLLTQTLQEQTLALGVELHVLLHALEVLMWKWRRTFYHTVCKFEGSRSPGLIPIAAGNVAGVSVDQKQSEGALQCLKALLDLPVVHPEPQLLLALERARRLHRGQAAEMIQEYLDATTQRKATAS